MAFKQDNEKLFEKINELYIEWESLDGRKNTESKKESVESKLIVKVCQVYCNLKSSEESYSVEIVESVKNCLRSYQKSEAKDRNVPFSKYVCTAISNALSSAKEKATFENRSGMKISADVFKKAKKVKKLDSDFEKFGFKDEKIRNIKIADALETTEKEVEKLKELLKRETVSQFQTDENGETVDIIDKYKASSFVPSENLEVLRELYDFLFKAIKVVFKEKKLDENATFKKALTVDLCRKHFPQKLADKKDGKDGQYKEERRNFDCNEDNEITGINKEKLFRNAPFFDSAILDCLFKDENYKLPELQVLAAEGGYSEKSGLSKKLKRFYEDVAIVFEEKSGFEKEFAENFLKV